MEKFDLEKFDRTAKAICEKANEENRLIANPSEGKLKRLVKKKPGTAETIYGNFVVESEPTSRAAMFTKNSVDHPFGGEEEKLLTKCEKIFSEEESVISLDRIVGNKDSGITVRLIVPSAFAHIAYGGGNLLLPAKKEVKSPTYQILLFTDEAFEGNKSKPLPQKDITIRLAHLPDGRMVKIIRNSNYIGEYKKGVFAGEDWRVKIQKKGIFLHAGCREDYLLSAQGEYRTTKSLIVALSANGKTTLTSKIIAGKKGEKSWIIQDDGGTFAPDGSFKGFEGGGFYAKTEGVSPGEQPEILYGLLKPDTLLENVCVDEKEDLDFYNVSRTSNGRAIIRRKDFMHAAPYIDAAKIDNLILVTRGPLIPAICELNREQAAALMVVGQAMESSAGDPTQAGKIRSEFFYDPFAAGNKFEHANRFYEIIGKLPHLKYYLINTGAIGEGNGYKKIGVKDTLSILDSLFRNELDKPEDWIDSPSGFKVPRTLKMTDGIIFHPEKLYPQGVFDKKQMELNQLRKETIGKIGNGLHPEIKKIF